MTNLTSIMERFNKLNIEVNPPKSLGDEEMVKKLQYFCPMAWDLLKPGLKSFISKEFTALVEEIEGKVIDCKLPEMDKIRLPHKETEELRIHTESINAALDTVLSLLNQYK